MSGNDEQGRLTVAEEAARWFVMNRERNLAESDRREFLGWLGASPVHIKSYLVCADIGRDLAKVVNDPSIDIDSLLANSLEDATKRVLPLRVKGPGIAGKAADRRPYCGPWSLGLAAVALVLAVTGLWWIRDGELLGLPRAYRTSHGEQRTLLLPDGSVVQLNSDSQISVKYAKHERVITVDRGQALFHVLHENDRRFRVVAGAAEVIAVGTQFDVYRRQDATLVTVLEGKVAVFRDEAFTAAAPIPVQALRVETGEQVRIQSAELPVNPEKVDLHQAEAWLQHQIVFEQQPLGAVAAEFNRYGRIPIEIADERLRRLPISGVFNAYDFDSFVGFLQSLAGVSVESTPTRVLVIPNVSERKSVPLTTAR